MLILKMAFRNILRQRRRTILTGLSMMIGFVLAVIFIGWSDGAYNNIIDTFTRNRLGHIQIHEKTYLDRPSLYKTIDEASNIDKTLDNTKSIQSWSHRLYSAGLASVGEKSAGVQIIGIDPLKETKTTQFNTKIIEGRNFSPLPSKEVIIGKGLAEILKAKVDDEIVIISQAADGSIANDLYKIIGLSSSGDDISDRVSFYLHIRDAQELLVLEGRIHEIAITVKKLGDVTKINSLLTEKIKVPELSVATWQVFAKAFYDAMKADQAGMWWMLIIIVIIVAVGVLNTVLMSVLERRREYGVLKAVGTKPSHIIRLVLLEVIILAIFCLIIGTGLGLAANSFLSTHGISYGQAFTYGGMKFETMYAEVNVRSFTIPAVTVFISAILVSLFPAIKAAKTEPAKTMRIH
ncbi:MAG: ABC transporter permease [Candidatus Aminicenantaceae bacterium]